MGTQGGGIWESLTHVPSEAHPSHASVPQKWPRSNRKPSCCRDLYVRLIHAFAAYPPSKAPGAPTNTEPPNTPINLTASPI